MRIAVLAQSLGGRAVEIGEWIARCPAQDIQPVVGSSSMDQCRRASIEARAPTPKVRIECLLVQVRK